MKDSRQRAETLLRGAEGLFDRQDRNTHTIEGLASMATAHAVLALLDYLQQDDTFEATQPHGSYGQYQASRIAQLEEDLAGAYAALRAREAADAAEMKERNPDAS